MSGSKSINIRDRYNYDNIDAEEQECNCWPWRAKKTPKTEAPTEHTSLPTTTSQNKDIAAIGHAFDPDEAPF